MGALGVRVVRTYSLLDPSFYSELRRYNLAHSKAPIYVIAGVWIPEDRFYATGNLWDPQLVREQMQLVDWVHGAVFGKLKLRPRPGYASGTWKANISSWVIGWSPGVEWDPATVRRSESINPPRAWRGKYISTRGEASSTEAWIAMVLDHMAQLDAKAGWSRAMTFTNWVTTDPLSHPYEPMPTEDAVAVDAMHLQATPSWPGGLFASYHVYPYYPDALSRTPSYASAPDPHGAYLRELRAHHQGQPVMITSSACPRPWVPHISGRSAAIRADTRKPRRAAWTPRCCRRFTKPASPAASCSSGSTSGSSSPGTRSTSTWAGNSG